MVMAALIHVVVILKRGEIPEQLGNWYKNWLRSKGQKNEYWDRPEFKRCLHRRVPIKVCAVWDTVDSVRNDDKFSYVKGEVTSNIERAYQALSMDERRHHFQPEVWWTSNPGLDLRQRWFRGFHADVGGGTDTWPNPISNVSLMRMIAQLEPYIGFSLDWKLDYVQSVIQSSVCDTPSEPGIALSFLGR